MTTNDTTTALPARSLKAGMIANQGLWGKGEPTAIREVRAMHAGGVPFTLGFVTDHTTCPKHTTDVTCEAAQAAYDFDSDTWR